MCKANVSGTGTPTRYKTFCHVGSQNENCEWQVWTANCANVPVCCQVKYPLALPFMVLPVWYQQNTGKWYAVCWYWTHTYARMTHAYTHASTHACTHASEHTHAHTRTHTKTGWLDHRLFAEWSELNLFPVVWDICNDQFGFFTLWYPPGLLAVQLTGSEPTRLFIEKT